DRLPSIRAKLGAVIVFAVAVTILIMYLAVGFALRKSDRDRQFRQALDQAKTVQALSFGPGGQPSRNLAGLLAQVPGPVLVIDSGGGDLFKGFFELPPQEGVTRLLSGTPLDTGTTGKLAFVGIPVTRNLEIVGAVYVAYRVERGGFLGAVSDTANFVRSIWW